METQNDKTRQQLAEEVRLLYRHLYWAAGHAVKIYNIIKPDDKPDIEIDKNQLSLFDFTEQTDEEKDI
jgi:hypothetical protein